VLQLNAFNTSLRAAVTETLTDIAAQCDGVRCDMAMLLLNNIFARTWGARAGARPDTDYWPRIIPAVKQTQPDFRFIARPTGIWSGSCSSRASTSATTKNSMTGWNTATPRTCVNIFWQMLLTSREWCGSSRTMTNPGRRPRSRPEKGVRPPWPF